jgi:hypothetical protein
VFSRSTLTFFSASLPSPLKALSRFPYDPTQSNLPSPCVMAFLTLMPAPSAVDADFVPFEIAMNFPMIDDEVH